MKSKIKEDIKKAMKDGDKEKVSALRLLLSEITNVEKKDGSKLNESKLLQEIQVYVKKLTKSLGSYKSGSDMYLKLRKEINIIKSYLPPETSEEGIKKAITEVLGSTENRDFGPLMGKVMKKVNADGKTVSKLLREML